MASSDAESPSLHSAVGIDVGGTFTDLVLLQNGEIHVRKVPTSQPQHHAIVDGITQLGVGPETPVAHGTTAATNALLERRGARTALVTTHGLADVLAIGRQHRPDLYDLHPTRPAPLVPAEHRYEVTERVGAAGDVVTPLSEADVRTVAAKIREADIESIAVVFLFSYRNPDHERRATELLQEALPGIPVTASHALLPEMREYERTATTVVNAYVRPLASAYLSKLHDALGGRPLRIMQSNGGTIDPDTAADEAARLALSGPAGGVVGALNVARRSLATDRPNVLTLDMGGTSTDVALCEGEVPRTPEHTIGGLPLRLPSIDIHTVGAGGGSIATVDTGGSLRVGPESAGATPGPACYGRGGTRPTVTDAHLVLGRLHPDHILGGDDTLSVDSDAAHDVMAALGDALGRTPEEAARGVLRIANAAMERALRRVSVERGHDPRTDVLVPFGGAGPLHAAALADALGIRRILVPPTPGVLSALGLLVADVVYDTVRAVLHPAADLHDDPTPLQDAVEAATEDIRAALSDAAGGAMQQAVELDLRYAGQSYELRVPLAPPVTADALAGAVDAFHDAHRQRYGHADPDVPVEVVAVRVTGRRASHSPPPAPSSSTEAPLNDAVLHTRPVWFGDAPVETTAYARDRLGTGHRFDGPAIVHQYDTTMVIPPGWTATVDAFGALDVQAK